MRGTLVTALLLAASSLTAAKSNQIDPRQLSHRIVKTPEKNNIKSSPRKFRRGSRKQRAELALSAADENRTIENAVTSATHSITYPSEAIGATRDAVRKFLDLNAFPEEVVRPQFDLNLPPSETSALLSKASNSPQRNSESTLAANDIVLSSSRTSNHHTTKTQASLDKGKRPLILKSHVKNKSKDPAALKAMKGQNSVRGDQSPFDVDTVYTLYLDHLKKKSLDFDPTKIETEKMLNLYSKSLVDSASVSGAYSRHFGLSADEDLEVLKKKLGVILMSTLSSLASLSLPPEIVKEIQQPFLWYASLERWRAMYRDFFEFCTAKSDRIKKLRPGVELNAGDTNDAVDGKLIAELKKKARFQSNISKIDKLSKGVEDAMRKYKVSKNAAAAVRKIGRPFLENEYNLLIAPTTASHNQPGNQRINPSPHVLQNPVPETTSFRVIESSDHARKKRPRSS